MAANKGTKQLGFDTKRKPLTKKQYDALSLKERLRMYDAAEKKEGSATGQRSSAGSLPTDVEERLTNKPYRYTERGRLGIGRTENVSESDIRKGQARAAEIKRTAKSGAPLTPKMAKGGSVSSASKRGDGCATKGKTKGRFV
jgi:hypothetical protein